MTLEQAAEKIYLKFSKLTLQEYTKPMPWLDLPELTRRAWKEIVRTCPVSKQKIISIILINDLNIPLPK